MLRILRLFLKNKKKETRKSIKNTVVLYFSSVKRVISTLITKNTLIPNTQFIKVSGTDKMTSLTCWCWMTGKRSHSDRTEGLSWIPYSLLT